MQHSRLIAGFISVLCGVLLATGPVGRNLAQAADTWDVIVGGDGPVAGITTYAYWPSTVTIHTGDTIRWSFFSSIDQHTVSFMRDDPPPPLYVPGPGAGEYTYGPAWFPITSIVARGTFDDTQDLSSGAEFGPAQPLYTLTFSTAGVYTYRCLLHNGMLGTVTVVDSAATLSEKPDQALARGQKDFQNRVDALGTQIAQRPPAPGINPPNGSGMVTSAGAVHEVDVGETDPGGASAQQFFPTTMTVRRGDTVVWTNTDAYGAHTVTFTSGAPLPDLPSVSSSGPPMLRLTRDVVAQSAGTSYTGAGYMNSGLLQPGASFALTIDAPPGSYDYVCLLHRDVMHGTIVVSGDASSS